MMNHQEREQAIPRPWQTVEIEPTDTELKEAFDVAHLTPAGGDRIKAQARFSELAAARFPDHGPFDVFVAYVNDGKLPY